MKPEGANYTTIYKIIKEMEIDISHMTRQGWNKRDTMGLARYTKIPLENILVSNSTYTSTHQLKKRLINAGLKEYACEICGLQEWNG